MIYRNVLHFSDYGSPYKGNFISSLEGLSEKLEELNHNQIFIFPKRTNTREWSKDMKIKYNKVYFFTGNFFKDLILLRRIIVEQNIDIIHIHFFTAKTLLLFNCAKKFLNIKVIIHLHGQFPIYKRTKKIIMKWLTKKAYFICCSKSVKKSFIDSQYNNKVYRIDNAVFFPRLDKYELLNKIDYGIQKNTITVLIFGYDYLIKGVDIVIQAISNIIKQKNINIKLLISISSNVDSNKNKIIKQLGGFPSWIVIIEPRNDIASYYNICDIFISASRSEGLCYALVEAAYCKTLSIASRIPAQSDMKLKYALWFESENIKDLENKIIEGINIGKYKIQLEEQKKMVIEEYDLRLWVKKIINIYDSI